MLVLSLCADCLMALPATAMAYPPSNNTVYSVRSFPATTTTRRDLTRESVSTDVQSDSDWGGIENLIVPQTKSQAEKDAEAKAQQEEETRKQAQEQAVRQAQTRAAQKEEANRSAERTAITPPASKTGQAVAEYAMQFSGYPYVYGGNQPSGWDCSGFVQYVFAQFGVSLPHQSGSQMSEVGTTLNLIATRRDGKRTMHYCLMFFLLGWLTLGIGWLVWYHKLSSRIGTEQAARGLPVTVTAATYWLWNILGSLIIVGPFIYTYKLLHAMNDLCADYNARG